VDVHEAVSLARDLVLGTSKLDLYTRRVRRLKQVLLVLAGLLVIGVVGFFVFAPGIVERSMNPVVGTPQPVTPAARALHQRLWVVDLHADSLLWGRDLLERGTRGQVDLPRLVEGNVALEVMDVVTKSPRGLNYERNDDSTDNILPLAIAQRWPIRTWWSLKARALYQAERWRRFAEASGGRLRLVRSRAELADFVAARRADPKVVGTVLGLEGAQALEGNVANLDALYDAGYRVISPSHFFDTELAGSAAGVKRGGLTDVGRAWLKRMEDRRMIVDLAHASSAAIDDVLALATRPVIISHTGVRGTCDNNRNLTDAQLERIAKIGGLIGIGFWDVAVCGADAAAIARAIVYVGRKVGFEHVALGSDYDGAVDVPFDVAHLSELTGALVAAGLDEAQIARVMGGNALAFFEAQLP
jgi:microsomal dipeptidase-like Zn-dependent dipeptidase